jgi:hypothetical protein
MHLRVPSIDQGVQAGIWAVFFGILIWIGLWALAFDKATAFIAGALSGCVIFLFVRYCGGDSPPADRRRAG